MSLARNLKPSTCSIAGTTVSTLKPISTPSSTPETVPMTPISAPWTMKICMIEPGAAPSVRRIAMSEFLSVTSITRVETMLNAATATISSRMMNITRFSISTARKKFAWLRVQRSEEHTSELQSQFHLVCRLLLENKNNRIQHCACPLTVEKESTQTTNSLIV